MVQNSAAELNVLWKEYTANKDNNLRNELLMKYVHIVKNIVYRMVPSYSRFVDTDDLMSCGVLGLLGAVTRFDINKGVNFETYACHRVRGEILDYLRRQDFVSSNLRQKIKSVEKAFADLENDLGRGATEQEAADYLKMNLEDLRKILEDSYTYNVMNLDDILADTFKEPESDKADENPEKSYENMEIKEVLKNGIDSLSGKERTVVTLYYYEELTLKEIGLTLNVSESRVSQIHSKALIKLRNKMKGLAG